MSTPCPICLLHGERELKRYEIRRSDLWLLRHHPEPAPLAGWLLLDSVRHCPGPLAFNDAEAADWGRATRDASRLVQTITGCDRVYTIAFGEGAQHLHLHLIPRFASDSATQAWNVADHYRAVASGERTPPAEDVVCALVKKARQLSCDDQGRSSSSGL